MYKHPSKHNRISLKMTHSTYPSSDRIFDSWLVLAEFTRELAGDNDALYLAMLDTAEEYTDKYGT